MAGLINGLGSVLGQGHSRGGNLPAEPKDASAR